MKVKAKFAYPVFMLDCVGESSIKRFEEAAFGARIWCEQLTS
jgi:hypothetical protein